MPKLESLGALSSILPFKFLKIDNLDYGSPMIVNLLPPEDDRTAFQQKLSHGSIS